MDFNGSPGYVEASITAADQQKRRILQKKIQKMKLQQSKSKSPHWLKPKKYRNTNVQVVIEAHYKSRLAKYKETNTQLAHVVADQKLEIAHWYNESVTLKSETQSLQEKLLRYSNLQNDELIDAEVERRILERCASLNQAVNSSMSSFLEAVEGISKVKELVGTIAKSSRRSKSISNVSSLPLNTSEGRSSSESIMLSSKDETVEDNRPSWQSDTKLTHMWRQRQQDRVQAAETPDMSVIGEQSTILDDTHNISVADAPLICPLLEVSEVSQMEEDLDNDKTATSDNLSYVSNDNDVKVDEENMDLLIQGSNIDDRKRISSVPMIAEEIIPDIGGEAFKSFEGSPCHLPKVKSSRRSSIRSRRVTWAPIEDRGATMQSLGSKMRKSSILHLQLDISSDFEEDSTSNLLIAPKSEKKILGENVSLSESISGSPRSSPATMLSRLEELENIGGRKGKRSRSKSKSLITIGDDPMTSITEKSSKITGALKLPEEENNDDRLLMPPPVPVLSISPAPQVVIHRAPQVVNPPEPSFLINDNDLTMNEQFDMSISDSIPNVIMVDKENSINDANNEIKNDCKGEKKFFQNPLAQENSTSKEYNITLNKNTPYDLSLLEETGVGIIPFSSNKDFKENCPSTTHNRKSEKGSEKRVRRCSIHLRDIINSPKSKDIMPPNLVLSPEVRLSLCSPIEKVESSVNGKKRLVVKQAESNCIDSSPILDKEKEKCKTKDFPINLDISDDYTQKPKDFKLPSTKNSSKSRTSLSLKYKNRKSVNKQENEVACSTSGRRRTKVSYIQQQLDSSVDISFSEDGEESWIKTPLKKKKSLVKPRAGKSIGATHQSLTNAKITEASLSIKTKNQKKIINSRSKKSKLNEDTSADSCVKPELTDKALITEPEQTSPEPECSLTTSKRQNQKKSRSSRSKNTKLNEDTSADEDTSAGDCVKPEVTDKALITAPEPEHSLTTSERKSTENSKKRVENKSQNTNSARKDSTSSSQASCISSDELPGLKSTNGTELKQAIEDISNEELNPEIEDFSPEKKASKEQSSLVKKNKPVCQDGDLVEDEKKCIDDAQSYQDASKRSSGTEAEEFPRRKRAACKNLSYKEPNCGAKMRNDKEGNSKEKKSKSMAKKTAK